tara:strand:- start:14 stop:1105 length:1092 start_codon:yes stop_codon:yes gene_type:complete
VTFQDLTEEEFLKFFSDIWDRGTMDSTYKFALGRFLVEYCRQENPDLHVSFATIAKYFLKYFWPQVCRSNLKHNGHGNKRKPTIVTCIENNFKKDEDGNEIVYTVNYGDWGKLDHQEMEDKVKTCVDRLSNPKSNPKEEQLFCFTNVPYAFQRIDNDFHNGYLFSYNQDGWVEKPGKTPVPKFDKYHGIDINPKAATFFKKYNRILEKVVILEWTRFLEKFNSTPKLIEKTEGGKIERNLAKAKKFTKILQESGFNTCFYNESHDLTSGKIHADHVIPFSYIREDELWNYVLSCEKCNLAKSDYLPQEEFLEKLIRRNNDKKNFIPELEKSLSKFTDDPDKEILRHYKNALSDGFIQFKGRFD